MRFRLLTYNIHRAIGIDRKFRPDRVAAIIQRYNADIVLLQEVDSGAPRSRMLDLAAFLADRMKYDHHVLGLNVFLRVGHYGNATLSRFPIGRQRNIDLTLGAYKRRGAQHTQIYLPLDAPLRAHSAPAALAQRSSPPAPPSATMAARRAASNVCGLDVFNIHLSLTSRMRRKQVAHLLGIDEMNGGTEHPPCLIAGDMNDWGGLLKRRLFKPAGFLCATCRRPGSRWALRTYPSFAPTGGLDKIFYRGPLHLLRVYRSGLPLARVASDHLPVIADFELSAG